MAGLGGGSAKPAPGMASWLAIVADEVTSERSRALILRLCAGAWFLFLSATSFTVISSLLGDIAGGRDGVGAWLALLSKGCIGLFYATICFIMLVRPEPVSRAKGLGPALLVLAGTYGAWLIPLLPRGPELPALDAASAAILLFSEGLIVYTLLCLGRSFSLMPQARKLVTNGPYAIVRHPLYVVEEAAIAGVLLQYAWFAALPFLALHVTVQIRRIQLEEEILLKTFPEYALYALRTPHLLPGVW